MELKQRGEHAFGMASLAVERNTVEQLCDDCFVESRYAVGLIAHAFQKQRDNLRFLTRPECFAVAIKTRPKGSGAVEQCTTTSQAAMSTVTSST